MKALQKNQGRTDHILGAMADILSSLALPSQQWVSEHNEEEPLVSGESQGSEQVAWDHNLLTPEVQYDNPERGGTGESYSVAGSEGSLSASAASVQPQASGSSPPPSPSTRRSVSTLKKWLTNPVRKLSAGGVGGKGERQVKRLEGRPPHLPSHSPELEAPVCHGDSDSILPPNRKELEWRDGPGGCEGGSEPGTPQTHSYLSQLLQGDCTATLTEDPQTSNQLQDDDGSTLLDDVSSQSSATVDSEEERRSALEKSMYVLKELIETEKLYVSDLGLIVEGYMATMATRGIPEDMRGKDKIVFGNIHQIFDWHKDYFLGELEKCVADPTRLAELFIKHERRLHMYVVYCQNKPKSEHIVSEYIDTYFEELKQQLGHRLQLNDLLIKPVQRIMKYQLLLKDFLKYYTKAGMDTGPLEGKITAQGKLLQQDTFTVSEQDSGFLSRAKERRVFLFEQLIIFSEPIDRKKGFSLPGYIFKNSIKVSGLGVEDYVDGEPCRFVLTSRGADGGTMRYVLQANSPETREAWVSSVGQILETQRNFLNALQSPIEYQRRESKSNSLGRAMRPPPTASTLRPHSSASIDRQRLPELHSHNTSLPSLYLPSHSAERRPHPESSHVHASAADSNLSSRTVSPAHIHLAFPELPGPPTADHCPAVSNGLCPPAPHNTQRLGDSCAKASPSLMGDVFAPGPSTTQRPGTLAQLDEDDL
ncbi:rho guanine nucleotide exchange factor 25 isoform X2 [Amia ocellicauda]|uniref:rho guanine nucleotide exchange factor 25 isoform X2 n=1 Tax=Amia ocellicauda TaxID=2972642 RepID=UPI0034642867